MKDHDNFSELCRTIFTAMNTRDFSEFEKIISPGVIFDFPGAGRIEGSKRVLIFLKALLRKYLNLEFTIIEIIATKERVVAVWTNRGEHIGGGYYANSGITLIHFSNGKITFISDYFKDTSFVK